MAYGFLRHPHAPITWGTGAVATWVNQVMWAYELTGDTKYLTWLIRTSDNILGSNPINRSYIVGAGPRTVRAPLHNSRYGHTGEVVSGQVVQGPNQRGEGYRVLEVAYPKIREDFASLYTFSDSHFCIAMDEGGSVIQANIMALFGYLLSDKN